MVSITKAITKCNYLVKDVNKLADIIREAFYVAKNGRPGPVVIDILKNVTAEKAEYEYKAPDKNFNKKRLATNESRPTYTDKWSELDQKDLDRAAKMINESKKPLIVCGGGVVLSRANDELYEFADKIDSPVAYTVMGCGGYDGAKEKATGLIGMHGTQSSNMAVANCDLLIVIGCRFSDRVTLNPKTFARNAKIVQIDIHHDRENGDTQYVQEVAVSGEDRKPACLGLLVDDADLAGSLGNLPDDDIVGDKLGRDIVHHQSKESLIGIPFCLAGRGDKCPDCSSTESRKDTHRDQDNIGQRFSENDHAGGCGQGSDQDLPLSAQVPEAHAESRSESK